jgi:hypothetical protein
MRAVDTETGMGVMRFAVWLVEGLLRAVSDRGLDENQICPAQDKERHPSVVLQPANGIVESEERFEGLPLFILHLETNGTYHVEWLIRKGE